MGVLLRCGGFWWWCGLEWAGLYFDQVWYRVGVLGRSVGRGEFLLCCVRDLLAGRFFLVLCGRWRAGWDGCELLSFKGFFFQAKQHLIILEGWLDEGVVRLTPLA